MKPALLNAGQPVLVTRSDGRVVRTVTRGRSYQTKDGEWYVECDGFEHPVWLARVRLVPN